MPKSSNLALDLAEACGKLGSNTQEAGGDFLASMFGVTAYSREFYEILTLFISNIDAVRSAIETHPINDLTRSMMISHLSVISRAFGRGGLSVSWAAEGSPKLAATHTDPLIAVSNSLKALDYDKPTPEEAEEILADAQQLLGWLDEHELRESDFIRICLMEGLRKFIFRTQKMEWVGWPYAVAGLRELIGAYLALERGVNPQTDPIAEAMLRKVPEGIRKAASIVSKGREAKENAQFLIGAYSFAVGVIYPKIAGYLSG